MLKKIVIALVLILWPLNFLLNFSNFAFSYDLIFKNDYQGEQLVLRNINLYPNIPFARVFQNKPRIYINKYIGNFFALTDPNNYFFALHPAPISGNRNIYKYPFLSIVFFLIGIFYLAESKYKKFIISTTVPSIFILSLFSGFEGYDFILWVPFSLIIINGINVFHQTQRKVFNIFGIIFILFAIPEILRSFFNS